MRTFNGADTNCYASLSLRHYDGGGNNIRWRLTVGSDGQVLSRNEMITLCEWLLDSVQDADSGAWYLDREGRERDAFDGVEDGEDLEEI